MEEARKPSLLAQVVTWIVVGALVLIALKVAIGLLGVLAAVFGIVLGLLITLLFTVAPIVLVGWLVMKLIERLRAGDEA